MRVKKELMKNKDIDEKLAKERIREKKRKAKNKLKEEMGDAPKMKNMEADCGVESEE